LIVHNRNGAAHAPTVKSRWSLARRFGLHSADFGRGSFASGDVETFSSWLLQTRFAAEAALTRLDGPAPLAKRLAEDTERWAQLVAKLGIEAE
jgi:hypothetical protein